MTRTAQTGIKLLLLLSAVLTVKLLDQLPPNSVARARELAWLEAPQAMNERLRSSRAVYSKPPLPVLPSAGGTFRDPVFGTEIMRATDEHDDRAGLSTFYSHWPTFNSDNTYVLVKKGLGGDALIKRFDPTTFTIGAAHVPGRIRIPGEDNAVSINFEGAIWHPTNPQLIYCTTGYRAGGMRLYTYNVVTRAYSLIKDFSELGTRDDYLWEMSMSADGDVFAWTQMRVGRKDNPLYYMVWRKSTDRILFHPSTSGIITKVRLDKSGQFLDLVYGQVQPDKSACSVRTLANGNVEVLRWNSNDSPPGHGDLGTGTIVGWDNWECGINIRRFNNVHSPRVVFRFVDERGVWDWTNGLHATMLANNEDWITVGTFDDPSANLPRTGVFKDEIFQVALDGSGRLRRICHTRSAIDQKTDATGYWAMPKPTISKDGRFIAFTSNWEKSGRFDVFIAQITPAPILTKSR